MPVPLRDRVRAPDVAPLPDAGLAWRPARPDDVDPVLALYRTADPVDHPHYRSTREEVEHDLTPSWVDLERDCILGFDGPELVAVALASLSPTREPAAKVFLSGVVRPDFRGRGIGRGLLAWQRARALQQLAAVDEAVPGWIWTMVDDTATATQRLLTAAGLPVARYFQELRLRFGTTLPEAPLPAGLAFAPWAPERQEEIRGVKNAVFADHWGSSANTPEQWANTVSGSAVRPDLSVLAETEAGEIAGFVLAEVDDGDWEGTGFSFTYLHLVGVPRAWRGRGVARAMLAEVLRRARDAGLEGVVLGVDSENPSGATRLYAALGFTPATGAVAFVEEV
jgi:mycothiol synthase